MCKYSKFNDPANYRRMTDELVCSKVPETPVYAVLPGEHIVHSFTKYCVTSLEELKDVLLDETDMAIVNEVASKKYLSSRQIFEYITLNGHDISRQGLQNRLNKLVKNRVIQRQDLVRSQEEDDCMYEYDAEKELMKLENIPAVKYYELDYFGFQLAMEHNVAFTIGTRYISYNRRKEKGIPDDTPADVKRILESNQIITGLLKAGVIMQRFAVMDTLRPSAQNQDEDCCMVRTTAYVRLTSDSILAYEVVRDTPEAGQKLIDKVQRYFNLVHSTSYLESNYHGDAAYPQLVICGENLSHNIRIAEVLRENGLWSEEDPILFTEDLLNMGQTRTSIYQLNDDNTQGWFELPAAVNAAEEHAAYI